MRSRFLTILIMTALLLASCGRSRGGSSTALVSIGAGLQGVPGTTATVYARGLKNVAALAYDSDNRLWAATATYDDKGTDAVYLITKAGATPRTVIAGLHTPLGLLWYRGSLYVASKRHVDVYSGFDGTSFATRHTIVTLPSAVGEVNQLVLAPNGRMLLGVSAACDHCVVKTKYAAAILSFAPDGSDLRVYARRIRAAVGLAFYPGTSDLFATLNQRDDLGAATPGDALALVKEGDDWGFPACDGQSGATCSAVPTATAVLDKHSAASGVAIVTGQLGATIGDSALVAEWSDGKVLRVALTKTGSAYTGAVEPFLTGLKNPVPVILGTGDSVLVGDWTTGIVYSISASAS